MAQPVGAAPSVEPERRRMPSPLAGPARFDDGPLEGRPDRPDGTDPGGGYESPNPLPDYPVTTPGEPAPPAPPIPAPTQTPPLPPPPSSGGGGGGGGGPFGMGTIYQRLQQILNQGPVSMDDPVIRDQLNAARAEATRGFGRDRAMLAERRAAQGLAGGGGFETGLRGLAQAVGQKQQGLASGLMADAQRQRASEIMSALQLGGNMLTAQERNALELQLAQISADLQREGMALQNAQFNTNMTWQQLLAMLQMGYA